MSSSTTSCAWVPVGAPPPLSNLRVTKTALNGGKCYKLPGNVIGCDYEVEIINDGPSPFLGPLSFTDEIPGTASLSAFPGAWLCVGGPPVACDSAAAIAIPVDGSLTMPVTVTTPLAPLEGAGCAMPNVFTLTAPIGTDENFFAGDDADTAEADAFLEWLLPDGTTLVTCDPTNLKTTKVAKGDCEASGGGFRCDYVVTVTNLGPDPYKGPIKISEQLGFAPELGHLLGAMGLRRRRRELSVHEPPCRSRQGCERRARGDGQNPRRQTLQPQECGRHDLPNRRHAVQRRGRRRCRFGHRQNSGEGLREARSAAMRTRDQ